MKPITQTPREITKLFETVLPTKLVPFIHSSPGMGKTAIAAAFAKKFNLELIDISLTVHTPEDLNGLPQFTNGVAQFTPFDTFPLRDTPVPVGKTGWLLLLDEFNAAKTSVQAAAYKLLLDKKVGNKPLHDNVLMLAAGNLEDDGAITNMMGSALRSRFIHFHMTLNLAEFIEDVAYPQDWAKEIIAFLNFRPSVLHLFDPKNETDTFPCPRTWEFVNKCIQRDPTHKTNLALLSGCIGLGTAAEFVAFCRVWDNLPTIDQIIRSPLETIIPMDGGTSYAAIQLCIAKATEDNIPALSQYIARFPIEKRVIFFKQLLMKHPNMVNNPSFLAGVTKLGEYL